MPEQRARRSQPSTTELAVVALCALAAGLGAAVAGTAATGASSWDGFLAFVLGATVTLAAWRAPRWTALLASTVAAGAAFPTIWTAAGLLALALAVLGQTVVRDRWVIVASVGIAVQALLRLPGRGVFGLTAVIAGLVFVLIVVGGYMRAPRRARRVVRWALVGVVAATTVIAVLGSVALLQSRTDVERGVSAARRGLSAVRSGEPAEVAVELGRADAALSAAHESASSVQARLLRLLPVASQHQRALEEATRGGAQIARAASVAVQQADLDTLQLVSGSLDLAQLERMGPSLRTVAATLTEEAATIGAQRSDWLVPPVERRLDELLDEIERITPDAVRAAEAVEIVPGLLGADRAQRYLVIFGTPAESREFGGFFGSWALIEARAGQLSLVDAGRIERLYDTARSATVRAPMPPWLLEMAQPTQFPQNLTSTPDFRTIATLGRELFDGAFDEPLDGYIYVDAWALIAMLELTGPVDVGFLDEPLTRDNAADFFFRDQYTFAARNEVFDGLAASAAVVLETLAGQSLPGPEELGRILGPSARAGRLQMVTFDEQANAFLESVALLRGFGPPGTADDFLGVVQTNGAPSKLDLFLDREVDYAVRRDGDTLSARVSVSLTSNVPADLDPGAREAIFGRDPEGRNRVLLSIYSPHEFVDARLDGRPVEVRGTSEFGLNRYLVEAVVPADGVPVMVEFDLVGERIADDAYAVELWHQPLVTTDQVRVVYNGPDGSFEWAQALTQNTVASASAD